KDFFAEGSNESANLKEIELLAASILIHLLDQQIVELWDFPTEGAEGKGHEADCIATQALACRDNGDGMMHKAEEFALGNQDPA
ncbi:hypothetical protein QQP08_010725, partial [Theobroma cacao]